MEIIKTLLWIVQMIAAISVIALVLLQHGKGADAGATFGSGGSSSSLFGATGSANFLSRTTAIFATIFFLTTFGLVLLSSKGKVGDAGVMAGLNNAKVIASQPITTTAASQVVTESAKSTSNQIPE
ncbi:MAG: preprotein translocase subunit SecG [Burkholderiales bacterium]